MKIRYSLYGLKGSRDDRTLAQSIDRFQIWQLVGTIDGITRYVVTDSNDAEQRFLISPAGRWSWKKKEIAIGFAARHLAGKEAQQR